jgi:hypothetical protein
MQDLSDSELEPELKYEGLNFKNEPLTYIKEFPNPIYNTLFPNILHVGDDDFDYSDMPELIAIDTDTESESDFDLDVATESESVLEPSLNIEPNLDDLNLDDLNLDDLNLDEIKRNIESTVNFSSVNEGLNALNNPDQLMNRIQGAFDSFKSQVGRNMTYSEMREMMG